MTYNPSNRKDVRSLEKEFKLAEGNRLAYTRRILSDVPGRKWFHDLLLSCHIGATAFVSAKPDQTAFNLGEQNIGIKLWSDAMNSAPAEYVLMMQEASQKEQVHDRRYSDERDAAGEQRGSAEPGRDANGQVPGVDYDPFVERAED